jgi:23S rRNA G2445 N2-methylase RlmL
MQEAVSVLCEAEVLEGLETIARVELMEHFRRDARVEAERRGAITFFYGGDLRRLTRLRSITAIYTVCRFPIPRPRALLGHQFFTQLHDLIEQVRSAWPAGTFSSLRLSAAGEATSVMQRIRRQLEEQTGLAAVEGGADLLIRVRPSPQQAGWEALVRLTPRPIAARTWRVCAMPGAMNAPLAYAMTRLSRPDATDRVLNICCGSGTLLIERLLEYDSYRAIGCDIDSAALICARKNVDAAGLADSVRLEPWDARRLPIEDGSVDVLLADLPFGQLIGSHRENELLYPALLDEAARVSASGARAVLLSHEVRLLDQTIQACADQWDLVRMLRVRSGGMMPGVFVLRRR